MNRNENVSGTVKISLRRKFIALKSKYWDEIKEDQKKSYLMPQNKEKLLPFF